MANISFYFDEMMSHKVAEPLIAQGYTVIMAVNVGMEEKDDLADHLRFATENECVLVTCDRKFAGLAMERTDYAGLICWTGILDDFGGQIRAFIRFGEQHTSDDVKGCVFWLK